MKAHGWPDESLVACMGCGGLHHVWDMTRHLTFCLDCAQKMGVR